MAEKKASSSKSTGNQKTKERPQKLDYDQFVNKIQQKAYQKYEERIKKQKSGDMLTDWLVAEKEIKKRFIY